MNIGARFKAVAVVALLGLLLLGGCAPKGEQTIEIRLGEVARTVFYAPQYVALSQGMFAQEGLDVQLATIPGGDKTMTALLSNQADIALIGAETSIYVYQQGAEDPIINFAQLTQTDGTFLFARQTPDSFDWEKLKGQNFLGQRKGGMPQMSLEFALRKHGIDPHKDLKLIQNIDFANVASAFGSGTGDYVQLFEPQASIFEKEGRGRVVASIGVESGELPYTVYMAKQSYLNENGEAVQKFTKAVYRAQQWISTHSPEQIAEAIMPYFKDTDLAVLTSSVKRYKEQGTYALNPIIEEKEWKNLQDVMTSAGELKSPVALEQLVNRSFAEKAIAAGSSGNADQPAKAGTNGAADTGVDAGGSP
ncbi:nitrate/sulfonate/bicarbonate ABC transporter periplasmic protein [Paenibacillus terrae HPL-003]|uniref:Nitrate/sulfonate/bicarbonate ABC transporter periplasmic protein n=1 Tax=Paenibacillus terrae (strain HPL-003) TaxID=985665 RepID=G7W373_PAETH|nr:ABC transporter substrate-binding protein [Paenibacillus terrae]AET60729.1 nitrate/sulfonate/bicarbonate ABC transporter periplasmic protein [Paenibacillus terrae HPL-003]